MFRCDVEVFRAAVSFRTSVTAQAALRSRGDPWHASSKTD
jgi:hypothetical protein